MDIGDSYEAAVSCLHQWKEFHGDVNVRTIFVIPYRGLRLLGFYFRCEAKTLKINSTNI